MAQATHAQVIDALAVILRNNIHNLNIVYGSNNLPATLITFPAAMILLGPDDYSTVMGMCEYWIRVFVQPVATGNAAKAYSDCLSLSTDFHTTFSTMRTNIADRFIDRSKVTVKSGFGNTGFGYTIKWGKAEFYGFQVNVPLASTIAGN